MIDITQVITNILPALGFQALADLDNSDWLQDVELYQWADEAQQRLAHDSAVFAEFDASTTAASTQGVYTGPAGWINIVAAYYGPAKLRPSTVRELLALDANWPATGGVPSRISMDAGNLGTVTIYPVPASSGTAILMIYNKYLTTISSAASTITVASPVQDFFAYYMLAEARRKEGEAAMPDMVTHFDQRVDLFHKIFRKYYGGGQ